ncbi:MAG TPA: TetR/AcrR family transcriptional regulator [Candidatus Binataceae bacterium]|nr:TetR/AcrR family transcriptional regulator [Candidatus Binataceae bacterium]
MAEEPQATARTPRPDNRRILLLDAAAKLFSERGFHATSMRDIAKLVDMLSGSIYYHFNSKQQMLLAVYAEGARRIGEAVDAAISGASDPWMRLEAASAAHLNALTVTHRDYAQVMIRTLPQEADGIGIQLRDIRREYEAKFRRLIDALPLPPEVDRHYLRLMLIGALNWSHLWYRPGGDRPELVAKRFIDTLRRRYDDGV